MIITGWDVETTGLHQAKGDRIIEIAMSFYDTRRPGTTAKDKLVNKWVQRINPMRSISPAAEKVHGISLDELGGCPEWGAVAPKVAKLMAAGKLLVAHNGDGFDVPFVCGELMRVGVTIPEVHTFDTMLNSRFATPNGKVPSLKELCLAFDVQYLDDEAHAADYDVNCMMECFFKGLQWGNFKLPDTLTAVAA